MIFPQLFQLLLQFLDPLILLFGPVLIDICQDALTNYVLSVRLSSLSNHFKLLFGLLAFYTNVVAPKMVVHFLLVELFQEVVVLFMVLEARILGMLWEALDSLTLHFSDQFLELAQLFLLLMSEFLKFGQQKSPLLLNLLNEGLFLLLQLPGVILQFLYFGPVL